MKFAIIERIENYDDKKPFNERYYLDSHFREIFDKLDILSFWISHNFLFFFNLFLLVGG